MKKLIRGIVEFRQKALQSYREKFGGLAVYHSPDALFIACSDSRVVPNVFASTDPGELFVVRNVGNLVPCCDQAEPFGDAEAAAVEFAVNTLGVSDVIVCGHSECAAMQALVEGREKVKLPHLKNWLRHGEASLRRLNVDEASSQSQANRLSQINVLQQLENLQTYEVVRNAVAKGTLKLHGWWFELSTANVYAYETGVGKFVLIDEKEAAQLLARL